MNCFLSDRHRYRSKKDRTGSTQCKGVWSGQPDRIHRRRFPPVGAQTASRSCLSLPALGRSLLYGQSILPLGVNTGEDTYPDAFEKFHFDCIFIILLLLPDFLLFPPLREFFSRFLAVEKPCTKPLSLSPRMWRIFCPRTLTPARFVAVTVQIFNELSIKL